MNNVLAKNNRESSLNSRVLYVFVAALISIVVALSVSLHVGVAWAGNDGTDSNMRVNDYSGILSEDDESYLSKKIKNLEPSLRYDIVVYISDKAGTAANAEGFYEHNDFGYGDASDGMILAYNPDSNTAVVYVNGVGSVVFSDLDIKALEDAFVALAKTNPSQAVYDFLANASIKVGSYRGVSVSSEWPNRTKTETASSTASPSTAGTTNTNTSTATTASAHTTAELDWYPEDPASFVEFHNPDAPRVVDNADLLTDEEEAALVAKIKDMEDRLGMDFVLYTDNSSYGLSRGLFAADFYTFNGYGRGDDYKGVVYFVCMEPGNRGFWTAACGSAQELMTEENVNTLDDATYDLFKSGDYAKAINKQFDNLDILYTNGYFPIDWASIFLAIAAMAFIVAIFALVMGLRDLHALKKKMKTISNARFAREYASGPFFSIRTDTQTDHDIKRTRHVEHESSGGGGSSGSSSYSGGYSSSGGSSHSFSGGGRSF